MSKSLKPLPRRLSAEGAQKEPDDKTDLRKSAAIACRASKPVAKTMSPLAQNHKKLVIEPRRIALKYATQTIVLEYKEQTTGKLRHRSFRIDVDRFETAAQCERKLWARLSKAVLPGSLQAGQVGKLVAQLFQHEKQQNPDTDELAAATERFMTAQVEEPTPTRIGLKPLPLADSQHVKPNLPEEVKVEKKGGSGAGSGEDADRDKENLNLAARRVAASPAANSIVSSGTRSAGGDNQAVAHQEANDSTEVTKGKRPEVSTGAGGDAPAMADPEANNSAEAKKVDGLEARTGLEPLPKMTGLGSSLFGDMPMLPGTLGGGAAAGRRAGLAPIGGSGGISGGFGSLTSSLGLPDDDDDDDDDTPPVFSSQVPKKSAKESSFSTPAAVHTDLKAESPVSAASSKGSGVDRFLGVGVKSPASSSSKFELIGAKKPELKDDSFELQEAVVEDEDIPDYADDFEDDFEDEDDNNLSLPLPGSNVKDKVGTEKKIDSADSDKAAEREETAEEKTERLRLRGDDVDLNKVEESELGKYKRLMEEEFKKNAIKPGDTNWVHDVQVNFGDAEEDCGWDEEDEEAEEEDDF